MAEPETCEDFQSLFNRCPNETAYEQLLAAEYMRVTATVDAAYFVLIDQFERQDPQYNWDPAYGEPVRPVRPEGTVKAEENWHFRDPVVFRMAVTEKSTDREETERGGRKVQRYTVAFSVADFTRVCCDFMEVQGGDEDGTGVGDFFKILGSIDPRPGDVVYLGGGHQVFCDVDQRHRRGYLDAKKNHTWWELELIQRSEYTPDRKDVLPDKASFVIDDNAGEGLEPLP